MLAKFFIYRPIFAAVIAMLIVLAGIVTMLNLPIAQFPEITPPVVKVSTTYPGANAETVVNTVALPIEQEVNGVEDMLYMQSTSTGAGTYVLNVTFAVGTDLDFAQVLVQNRVATALPSLPEDVSRQGVTTEKVSTAILLVINLTSPDGRFDDLFMSNYATINIVDVLKRIEGVGDVTIFGAGDYSMRVWLDPDQLKTRNIPATDVVNAIRGQNIQVAAGQIGAPPAPQTQAFQYTINVRGRLTTPEEFGDIVVKAEPGDGGRITRVRDVARVELGAQTYTSFSNIDGKTSAGIAIYQLPGANALEVAAKVKAAMADLKSRFPQGLDYSVNFDTTVFTQQSIDEVYQTLFEAAILVFLVIFIFLQDFRATIIPAIAIPVSLIGTFAAMAVFGVSINTISLFGLVLAIGIVVDDAIIVVENTWHHMQAEGLGPRDAVVKAMSEISGPIIATTLVLMAVFVPAAFLPGITGQLFYQFAITIALSTFFSSITALSLSPALCGLVLRPPKERRFFLFRAFNAGFDRVSRGQHNMTTLFVKHRFISMLAFLGIAAVTFWGFGSLPTGFLPQEDQGYAIVAIQLPDSASLSRTARVVEKVSTLLRNTPGIAHTVEIGGISLLDNMANLSNAAVIFVVYDSFEKRAEAGQTQASILTEIRPKLAQIQEGLVFAVVPPAIQGLGSTGGFQMQLQLRGGDFDFAKLQQVTFDMIQTGNAQTGLANLNTSFRADTPQLFANVNRTMAETLNVPVDAVFQTLQAYLGSVYVNQFNEFGRTWQVFVQADSDFRLQPQDIRRLYVRNRNGEMVPIGAITDVHYETGPAVLSLYNLYPTAAINGVAAPGFSSGQALSLMEQMAAKVLPSDMGFEWTGMSFQEKAVGNQAVFVFALSLLVVFLVLAAQYESWTNPAAVILAVPLALLGVVVALIARSLDNNVYTQIGLVLLIALAAKNAILIVEFARDLHAKGMDYREAAVEASKLRFRPILMTAFAFILGVVPLVIASGAGAASRQALGTVVFGGMIAATAFNGFFVPVFYAVLQGLSERRTKKTPPGEPEEANDAPQPPLAPASEAPDGALGLGQPKT